MKIKELYEQAIIVFGADISRQMFLNILHGELKYISKTFSKSEFSSYVGEGTYSLGTDFRPPVTDVFVEGKRYVKVPWRTMFEALGTEYQSGRQ